MRKWRWISYPFDEVRRIRSELNWRGRLVLLIGSFNQGSKVVNERQFNTHEGLAQLAKLVDGIGLAIGFVVSGKTPQDRELTNLVEIAHVNQLVVHPYTMRLDELPSTVSSADDLMDLLSIQATVDGLFTDFPDVTAAWLKGRVL